MLVSYVLVSDVIFVLQLYMQFFISLNFMLLVNEVHTVRATVG